MSDDPLIQRLSQLTPDGSGLDRDALLFAAGRASVRPSRCWPALAGALALSQVMVLAIFLWPRPAALVPDPDPIKSDLPIVAIEPPLPPVPAEAYEPRGLWALREEIIAADGKLPLPAPIDLAPSKPPLHIFGPLPAELVN